MIDVLRARQRIAPHVRRTPLVRSTWLSDLTGGDVRLKLESLGIEIDELTEEQRTYLSVWEVNT